MGTSNSSSGPKGATPLVPSWIEPIGNLIDLGPSENSYTDNSEGDAPEVADPIQPSPIPPAADNERFRSSRGDFTRYVRSNGNDHRSISRAISSYISSGTAGPKNAAKRMGAARLAGANFALFLTYLHEKGASKVLASLNLASLIGKSVEDVFLGIIDLICPNGGTIDEGIAREAFIETIAEISQADVTNLEDLDRDKILLIFETYATHSVEAKIYNDIGTKLVLIPNDAKEIDRIQSQLHDFIRRGFSDAFSVSNWLDGAFGPLAMQKEINKMYEQAFSLLSAFCLKELEHE